MTNAIACPNNVSITSCSDAIKIRIELTLSFLVIYSIDSNETALYNEFLWK